MTGAALYVYTVVVERWPDWCPDGWERFYTDTPSQGIDDQPEPEIPDELRRLADEGLLPDDFPLHRVMHRVPPDNEVEGDEWEAIVCPVRTRRNWLSGAAANRWARHATALGAIVHVRRGRVLWDHADSVVTGGEDR
jgi:hypothetical protein